MIERLTIEGLRRACEAFQASIEVEFPLLRVAAIAPDATIAVGWTADEAALDTDRIAYVPYPCDLQDTTPDDTALSLEEWNAKVEAVLAECEAHKKQSEGENPFFDV